MHDRYALGCTSEDAYVSKFNLASTFPNCKLRNTSMNNPSTFYTSGTAISNFENRCKHILSFASPNFNGRAWGSLGEVILAFDIQNEPQALMSQFITSWTCDRATALHSLVSNGVLLSSGGGHSFDDSIQYRQNSSTILWPLFFCQYIDVVAVHAWDADEESTKAGLLSAVTLASKYQKKVIFESFGINR